MPFICSCATQSSPNAHQSLPCPPSPALRCPGYTKREFRDGWIQSIAYGYAILQIHRLQLVNLKSPLVVPAHSPCPLLPLGETSGIEGLHASYAILQVHLTHISAYNHLYRPTHTHTPTCEEIIEKETRDSSCLFANTPVPIRSTSETISHALFLSC